MAPSMAPGVQLAPPPPPLAPMAPACVPSLVYEELRRLQDAADFCASQHVCRDQLANAQQATQAAQQDAQKAHKATHDANKAAQEAHAQLAQVKSQLIKESEQRQTLEKDLAESRALNLVVSREKKTLQAEKTAMQGNLAEARSRNLVITREKFALQADKTALQALEAKAQSDLKTWVAKHQEADQKARIRWDSHLKSIQNSYQEQLKLLKQENAALEHALSSSGQAMANYLHECWAFAGGYYHPGMPSAPEGIPPMFSTSSSSSSQSQLQPTVITTTSSKDLPLLQVESCSLAPPPTRKTLS
jgi:hypothetical protein